MDPLGEYEDQNSIYTLTAYVPDRIPNRYQQWVEFRSSPLDYSSYDPRWDHMLGGNPKFMPYQPPSYVLRSTDLKDMKLKVFKVKAYMFPLEMRCSHVCGTLGGPVVRECREGCYILEREGERGGSGPGWRCERKDCEGHRYCGRKRFDENGRWCFGKKGERLVCIQTEETE